jgi:hypothetical protein
MHKITISTIGDHIDQHRRTGDNSSGGDSGRYGAARAGSSFAVGFLGCSTGACCAARGTIRIPTDMVPVVVAPCAALAGSS